MRFHEDIRNSYTREMRWEKLAKGATDQQPQWRDSMKQLLNSKYDNSARYRRIREVCEKLPVKSETP